MQYQNNLRKVNQINQNRSKFVDPQTVAELLFTLVRREESKDTTLPISWL